MDKVQKMIAILTSFAKKQWYGKLEISFENGIIVNVKITENMKL